MAGPRFEIGVIADVQYADLDNGNTEGRTQRFREVPQKLETALKQLCAHENKLSCILHLGDITNGGLTEEHTRRELELVAGIFENELDKAAIPAVHVLGNHCLEIDRATVMERLKLPQPGYYVRDLPHNWRLIVLDTTEISGHAGYPEGSWQYEEARAYEQAHPLSDDEPQMSSWNGGISKRQMEWFVGQLKEAEKAGARVIVACHHQVGEGAARATHMAWNWKEIEQACVKSPLFCLALAGHDHMGGYSALGDEGKKHFITLQGLVEAPADGNAYAILQVFEDRIVVQGFGTIPTRNLAL